MDANRFDTLTRLIGSRTSRRIAIGLGAAGLLSIGVPEAEAIRCSRRNPCPECYRCRKQRCRPRSGTACSGGTCQNGTCIALCQGAGDGTPCGDQKECKNGTCQCRSGWGECLDGSCAFGCCIDDNCPSGSFCRPNSGCFKEIGTCPAGTDLCARTPTGTYGDACNNNRNCICITTVEGGTECVDSTAAGGARGCTSDEDCQEGWVCWQVKSPGCTPDTVCALRCAANP